MSQRTFPEAGKGTYVLLLRLTEPVTLTIGLLGRFDFLAGWYAYVGSAFGPGGLRGRLKHHLSPAQRPHWHIDYLRQVAPLQVVWYLASERALEHTWSAALQKLPGATVPAPRFGASDCRCAAHLIQLPDRPDLDAFRELVKGPVAYWPITG